MSYRDPMGGMRPGQNNKRSRGRGGNHPNQQSNNSSNNNNNNNNNNRPRMPNRMQTFDSNGPSVKIRGNAYQVFERYVALAREAQSSGDRVAAENFYQHAEHYFRVMNANGDGQNNQLQPPRPTTPADTEMSGPEQEGEQESDQAESEPVNS